MDTIEGVIEDIIFANEVNGYTVCEIKKGESTVTAVGFMPFLNVGESVKLSGKWVTHPDYGDQLKVEHYEKLMPQTTDAVEKYLSSGVIKGIGPATASKIVSRFGDDTLNILQLHPERLAEIRGISLEKAGRISQAFNEQRELRNVIMFFQDYGISASYSTKIYKVFGEDTIEKIKNNPYKLADEVFGIGFKTADRIAMSLGIDPASKYRVCSGIKYVLSQCAAAGHTYITDSELKQYTSGLLEVDISNIDDALATLMLEKAVCTEKEDDHYRVYLSSFFNAELGVCRRLTELACTSFQGELDGLDSKIDEIEKQDGIKLAEDQRRAVTEAMVNGVMVITGGPGTGKTTIIKSIIKLLISEGHKVALAAPTGRAAKRMTEATGFEARTIHRLLEIGYTGEEGELLFNLNEFNPIDADVVIIDEMSMVDILLMNHLLKAIAPGTRLILVGDVDQLPSVGAGNVLRDIIGCGAIRTVKLTEIFRQAGESMIIVNAHRINKGEKPYLNAKDKDFFFISRGGGEDIVRTIVELCSKRLPDKYGYDPLRHIQVLTPTRKGVTGVANLNIELQKVLNPENSRLNEKIYRNFIFREGDRVMQIKNNYNLKWERAFSDDSDRTVDGTGVFNGDMGIIEKIDNEEQQLTVLFDDDKLVQYDYGILDELEPAFAVTIHKSQGSEFPVAIIPLFPGPQMLINRNLLYTAVTRAKKLVVLVGQERILHEMIANQREMHRNSGLCDRIRRAFEKPGVFGMK